jgi:hypothetical protein
MNALQRPLVGCTAGLSISESEDSTGRGFPAWQVNRVTLQVVAALFDHNSGFRFLEFHAIRLHLDQHRDAGTVGQRIIDRTRQAPIEIAAQPPGVIAIGFVKIDGLQTEDRRAHGRGRIVQSARFASIPGNHCFPQLVWL